MRIPGSSLSKTGSRRSENAQGVKNSNPVDAVAPAPAGVEDSVATGNQSALVSQALQADAVGRSERVSELKSALESGSYQADPAEVSRAMIAEALASNER
jgi:flagellar biosynthesis anti-sigma factor FlgM